ncbi:MAG: hypothetical protein KJO69_00140 [Gammaproteobacteria bacterium]|nr:hypothetical protein [Gammaproteobacteria bacterium]
MIKLSSWTIVMKRLRINAGAVCRQLLTNLKTHKPLTSSEERRLIHAIESTNIPNATDRLLAGLSRNTLEKLLGEL